MHVKESVACVERAQRHSRSHLFFGDRGARLDFVSPGRGGVPFERVFRAL